MDSSGGHSLVTCELLLIHKPHDDAQLAGFLQQQGNKDVKLELGLPCLSNHPPVPAFNVVVRSHRQSEHGPLADPPHVTVDPRILIVLEQLSQKLCCGELLQVVKCSPDVAWWKKWQGKQFPDRPMNPLSFLVCCLEAKICHLPHHCLSHLAL